MWMDAERIYIGPAGELEGAVGSGMVMRDTSDDDVAVLFFVGFFGLLPLSVLLLLSVRLTLGVGGGV